MASANYGTEENLRKSGFRSGRAIRMERDGAVIVAKFRTEDAANREAERYHKAGWTLTHVYFPE